MTTTPTTPPSIDVLDMMCRKAAMDVVDALDTFKKANTTLLAARYAEYVVRYQWQIAAGQEIPRPASPVRLRALNEARAKMGVER